MGGRGLEVACTLLPLQIEYLDEAHWHIQPHYPVNQKMNKIQLKLWFPSHKIVLLSGRYSLIGRDVMDFTDSGNESGSILCYSTNVEEHFSDSVYSQPISLPLSNPNRNSINLNPKINSNPATPTSSNTISSNNNLANHNLETNENCEVNLIWMNSLLGVKLRTMHLIRRMKNNL